MYSINYTNLLLHYNKKIYTAVKSINNTVFYVLKASVYKHTYIIQSSCSLGC